MSFEGIRARSGAEGGVGREDQNESTQIFEYILIVRDSSILSIPTQLYYVKQMLYHL